MIRVIIADDQQLLCEALSALLSLEEDIEVIAQASTSDEALAAVIEHDPDVVLLDIEMPGSTGDGIACAHAINEHYRGSNKTVRILMLTAYARPGYLQRALQAGASGFVTKDIDSKQLAETIRKIHHGLRVVDSDLAAASLSSGASPLTEREAQVLAASAGGANAREIGQQLYLSAGTVRNHISSAMAKLNAHNRVEAVRIARDNGWITL
ncbi:MAG: response regulator transcription factor [Rothia sp. (in: high G+C Gram-positive bacteria)]|uniref:response regulator transcription factor n=1 Tax=Rothia sp. (in: high G+C Gram-positive bacteria) TaxID=1885016 RepID=UPI0026DFBC4D|nr:response regulator transcription factor [Rothia sp. (in: high G+C Gram-positive bacteria)]MDO5750057.1 response regulator transcription factor [Rothia sp. (in: high G+C Gram-positive bacteria)]